MVKQVKPLSDVENIGFGLLCGFTDVALFQPMNYWKNAVQQSLPFTLNPSLLYRGVAANLANNSFCVGAQFWLNGVWRKMITGDDAARHDAQNAAGRPHLPRHDRDGGARGPVRRRAILWRAIR